MNTLVFENAHTNGHSNTQPASASTLAKSKSTAPDPQVIQKPTRRRFSVADKLRILKLADACDKPGELGALLRREGLYSSSLASFRHQQAQGRLRQNKAEQQVTQRKQKQADRQRDARQLAQMQKEILQLRALLDLQKKLSDLMGLHLDNQNNSISSE